jgi:hypothetical protein
MDNNQRRVLQRVIPAVVVILVAVFGYWLFQRNNQLPCPDGSKRVRIDSGSFATQYSANTVKLQGELRKSRTLFVELGSAQLLQMSEAVQLARLHLQALAEGYNSCAVGPEEFNESRNRFQRLEDLAGQINSLNAKENLRPGDQARLKQLTTEFIAVANTGARTPSK